MVASGTELPVKGSKMFKKSGDAKVIDKPMTLKEMEKKSSSDDKKEKDSTKKIKKD